MSVFYKCIFPEQKNIFRHISLSFGKERQLMGKNIEEITGFLFLLASLNVATEEDEYDEDECEEEYDENDS